MKIEKGKQYRCIKNLVMEDGEIAYINGNIYVSEMEDCITDEQGCIGHLIDKEELFFEEVGKSERSNTYTPPKKIDWEQRRFELVKAMLPQSASIVNEALFRGAKYEGNKSVTEIVSETAISYADAVIAKLKEENV